ncbi:MAG TPA: hypothetical protein ENL19_02060 [candidate division WOR-3 bacterium]|uniref:Polysaccharide pyruvyl transferase domain-containing protein n=1 Tax=candidate division WOR-3 bacterium TaxID=2052148 RepID=A0A7C5HBN2_UNCW3|nr:hypothetical protein [candidate division WOR-3 bacterium]
MYKVLFANLATESTGEVIYLLNSLKRHNDAEVKLYLLVHEDLKNIAERFNGEVILHPYKEEELLEEIKKLSRDFHFIILNAVNAAILESCIRLASKISETIEYLLKKKVKVGVNDIHASCVRTFEEREKLIEEIKEKAKKLVHPQKKRMYYFESIVPRRARAMILFIPQEVYVFRSVPLTFPRNVLEEKKERIFYYDGDFIKFERKKGLLDKILISHSRVASRMLFSLYKEKALLLLENLIGKVIPAIYESLKEKETKEIILMDPNECFQKESYKNLKIKRYKYVPPDEFRDILSRVLFTVSFVSHTTIGVYSILNGIPFLSIYSSRFSTDIPWMDKILFPLYLPPFESLGQIEGDIAWRGMFSNNPYFEAIVYGDISDEENLHKTIKDILTGVPQRRIDSYITKFKALNLPLFSELICDLVRGGSS